MSDNEVVRLPGAVKPGWLVRRARTAVIVLIVVGVGGFLIDGANRPANPYLLPASGQVRESAFQGFGAVTLSITTVTGRHLDVCTLEARTEAERERGLMAQRSLHGFAGMVFVFASPSSDLFYMKDTPMPLTVAWFDSAGLFIASATMPVCPSGTVCPTYSAGRPFGLALEVPAGGLGHLGLGPGASAQLGGPCSG